MTSHANRKWLEHCSFIHLRRVYAQYMNDTYIFPKIYEDMQLIVFLAYVSDIRVVSRQFVILER